MVHFITAQDGYTQSELSHMPIYHEVTKHVSALVGHECLPADRRAREVNYRQALSFVNSFSDLGLDAKDIDLFGLYFTALSDSRRFGGDKVLEKEAGENPSTHSLQAVCLKQRIFDEAANAQVQSRSRLSGLQRLQHLEHSQMTGLAVLMHDMGEVLGEFTTAVQRFNDKNLKEDPEAERTIFRYVLRMALEAQETGDREKFFARIDDLKKKTRITKEDGSAGGIPKSSEFLNQYLQPPITLSAENEQRFAQLTAVWDMAEGFHHPLHDTWEKQGINVGFVNQMTKSIDHVQGTRHMVRWARKGSIAQIPDYGADRSDIAHVDQNRAQGNLRYCEAEAGGLFAKLGKAPSPVLTAIARQQAASLYNTISDLVDVSPPVPLGYQIVQHKTAVIKPGALMEAPAEPGLPDQKRAQGAMRGLYERARDAVLRGEFVPALVDDGKGGKRSQLLGIDGITPEQEMALYHPNAKSLGRSAA